MKNLKSLDQFKQSENSMTKIQLKNVTGGYIQYKTVCTCRFGCDDEDRMGNEYNPMTGRWSGWYLVTRTFSGNDC